MTELAFFYAFTTVMFVAALAVVVSRQPIYSVLALLVVMGCLACLFVMLGAYFVAALQLLLYAGAVLVLFLFVIMLLNLASDSLARMRLFTLRTAGTIVALTFLFSLFRILTAKGAVALGATPPAESTVEAVGQLLFTKYLLPFELTSFLILAAIIGAVTLARQPRE